jgi:hypothetical protein
LNITINSVLVRDDEARTADLDRGIVVLSLRAGSYFSLNEVAAFIWYMIAKPRSVGQIFEALTECHDVDATTLARDVTPFLRTLVERRLARMVDPSQV